ncbi:PREDICTED: tRNA (adenine(58)-N(1))-methyltransferase non-catalytic subunit trm6 isoform X1 [Nicotiana attenuata]|uniref:tRNA (adenine(58)-N(1))-methyltransferase non-catalytic subunit trm6 isoform X1 n=1 Tax=Nicotiana attenuata TaxID=49451 RepID=UPI000905722C|nr:PREDICTED: tRNA (adenine(58)-N(1))-methyltransferase non-catalytic subunit trm6 isoform X1 [Nicotiana attenuata]
MSINKAVEEDSNQNQNSRLTWEGCNVLLDINDGDRLVFARLTAASTLKIGNKKCCLQPLVGCPFGSLFLVESGKEGPILSRFVPNAEGNNLEEKDVDGSKDNRAIVDNNTAQSLTSEDIDEMRRQGAKGDEIVDALIANSATFEKKTLFSQEKYRIKKQKKYAPRVLVRRPSARSICEAYFKKHPDKIGFMRVDALSLLLCLGNVTANADVLVVDMVGGILTGAIAERLGAGTGYVCNTYRGSSPYPVEITRMFNLNDEICKRIVHASLTDLNSFQTGASVSESKEETLPAVQSGGVEVVGISSEHGCMEITPETVPSPIIKPCKSIKPGQKALPETIELWKENGFSSLIIAAPELEPWGIVKEVLPLLSFSAPFAVYHQYAQPLATCMHNLQIEKMAIGLQISEPWLREYQVLPSRTHPHMQMSAFGGYILSGTKISSSEPVTSSN